MYVGGESEEFVFDLAVRDGSERRLGYVLLMLLYTEPLRIVALSLFAVAFEIPDSRHSCVYLLEGKR